VVVVARLSYTEVAHHGVINVPLSTVRRGTVERTAARIDTRVLFFLLVAVVGIAAMLSVTRRRFVTVNYRTLIGSNTSRTQVKRSHRHAAPARPEVTEIAISHSGLTAAERRPFGQIGECGRGTVVGWGINRSSLDRATKSESERRMYGDDDNNIKQSGAAGLERSNDRRVTELPRSGVVAGEDEDAPRGSFRLRMQVGRRSIDRSIH